jgi:1-acyl-sn-glycerol-3-phosphate acyltransferase
MATIRFWLTMLAAALLLLVIGIPAISLSWLALKLFGKDDLIYPFAKFGCAVWVRIAGGRVHVSGREHLDPAQTYLFAANHQSNIDPPLLFAYLGHNVGCLAKKELTKFPIIKQGFPLAHVIPIDRRNREAAIESTRRGAEKMLSGHSLLVFPEGTRTEDGRLKDFKKGVFYMALESGVSIVPVVVNDTRLVMRKGETKCHAHDVYLEILPPVSAAGYTEKNLRELIERVRQPILERARTDQVLD